MLNNRTEEIKQSRWDDAGITGDPMTMARGMDKTLSEGDVCVAHVYLLQPVHLLPGQSIFACVEVDLKFPTQNPLLIECETIRGMARPSVSDALVQLKDNHTAQILAVNSSGFIQTLELYWKCCPCRSGNSIHNV